MDPDQALADGRRALKDMQKARGREEHGDAAARLADAWDALDGWMSKGGFLPADWTKNREGRQ